MRTLGPRCLQIYSLEARCTAAEERADESERTAFDTQQELAQLQSALEGVRSELSQTTAALTASRQEGAKAREEAAAAAATAAERLAKAEAAAAAAKTDAMAAHAFSGEAAAKAAESTQLAKRLQEQLDTADRELSAVQELTRAVHKQLMETECVAAFAVEEAVTGERGGEDEGGAGSPTHQVLDLAHKHIEVRLGLASAPPMLYRTRNCAACCQHPCSHTWVSPASVSLRRSSASTGVPDKDGRLGC